MKIFERSVWSLITAFFAIFLIIVYVGSSIAMQYGAYINSALGIQLFQQIDNPNSDEDTEYYKSDYYYDDGTYNDAAMRANSNDVAERTASESTVLLWNNDDALPLAKDSKIGFFGIASQRYIYTGTGSGYLSYSGDKTIKDAVEAKGIDVYDTLWAGYTFLSGEYGYSLIGASASGVNDRNYGEYGINEAPWSAIEKVDNSYFAGAMLKNYSAYEDAAVMVISRNGGEDYDTNFAPNGDDRNLDGDYLDLSEQENDVLTNLTRLKEEGHIKKVVLLINSATPLQLMNIAKLDIDACLWVGMGGNKAPEQIANVLVGDTDGGVTPSGHLVDTWAYDISSAPANANFGDHTFTSSTGLPEVYTYTHNNKYLVYQEGIYVGYRYYETRYEDAVLGQGSADSAAGAYASEGNWDYREEVAYTFGHGESYTDFEFSNYKVTRNADGDYEVSVDVKNVGDTYSGKEVLQVYIQKPYTGYDKDNGIEKSAVELVGFEKSDSLAPGASQTLKTVVDDYEFKTYDAYGKGTYILEKGDYYLACGTSAHNALNNILANKKADGVRLNESLMDEAGNADLAEKITISNNDFEIFKTSPYTGAEVGNLFSNADINLYEGTKDQKIEYLSREKWQTTYPSSAVSMSCLNATMVADMQYYTGIKEDPEAEMPKYETVSEEYGQLNLVMLMEFGYDDPIWDALMDQTTYAEQTYLVTYGAHVLAGAESVNAPGGLSQNGPSGLNQANPVLKSCMVFPCQVNMAATWNKELIEELGEAFGMEMMHAGYEGLNGPGANIHRSAHSGRNWEYYSEDGFISGEMLSAETTGMMRYGAILYIKHMLLNDEERNRYGVSIWANEQSIREIYAKAFEKACAVTGLNGIMSSFNRIGCIWAGRHKGLLNDLLRVEWGFEGAVQSDAAVGRHMGVANDEATNAAIMAEALLAGQDFWLWGGSKTILDGYKDNATVACALREAARRMLYTQLHSTAMNGVATDTVIIQITPWWESVLNVLKIVAPILVGVSGAMTVVSFVLPVVLKKKQGAQADGNE